MGNDKLRTAAYSLSRPVSILLYAHTGWDEVLCDIDFSNGYRAVREEALTVINKAISIAFAAQGSLVQSVFDRVGEGTQDSLVDNVIDAYGLVSDEAGGSTKYASQTTTAADKILGAAPKAATPVKQQVIDVLASRETFTETFVKMFQNDEGLTIRNLKSTYLSVVNSRLMSIKKG